MRHKKVRGYLRKVKALDKMRFSAISIQCDLSNEISFFDYIALKINKMNLNSGTFIQEALIYPKKLS